MDIIIPYRNDINGIELKYALRSIDKYLSGYDFVFLVGDKPEWVKMIGHIACEDIKEKKEQSIIKKILKACEIKFISDDFIMWHDDHFLLKPLKVSEIKNWYEGMLSEKLNQHLTSGYRNACLQTQRLISDGLFFDIHTPIKINKEKFIEKFEYIEKEICLKTYYMKGMENSLEEMKDLKMDEARLNNAETIMEIIKDRLFFSTGPRSVQPAMIEVWESLYHEKSKFEL